MQPGAAQEAADEAQAAADAKAARAADKVGGFV
jgi:hypothetical protein